MSRCVILGNRVLWIGRNRYCQIAHNAVPHGVTLIGQLFDEGTLGQAGFALERAFNVAAAGALWRTWQ